MKCQPTLDLHRHEGQLCRRPLQSRSPPFARIPRLHGYRAQVNMVVVARVGTRFEAELLAAKLGSMGILWEIRSRRLVEITYPIGSIEVLVPEEEADDARELLTPEPDEDQPGPRPRLSTGMKALRLSLALSFLLPLGIVLFLWMQSVLDIVE